MNYEQTAIAAMI